MADIPKDWLGNVKGSAADAKKINDAANDLRRHSNTTPKILSVKDIQSGGEWDASRTLETTLGGVKRNITADDLKAFKENIKTAKASFKGGMTAQQVINHALPIDRERASQQITMATPVSASKNVVKFITNSSGETKGVYRHYVTIAFSASAYESEAASSDTPTRQSVKKLLQLPLSISCDCGRWRFWYSYVATIGQFNSGRAETGFPKIRNPNLNGVACKHLLRVMKEITLGGAIKTFLERHLEKAKAHDENKARSTLTQKEAEKLIKSQSARTSDKHEVAVKEKAARKVREAIEIARKEKPKETKKKAPATKAAKPNKNMTDPHAQMRAMLKQLGQSDTQIEAMIAASIAAQGK